MRKPDGYDDTDAREGGFKEPSPGPGPYILGIIKADSGNSGSGHAQLVFHLDIADGPFKNHFRAKGERFNGNFYMRHYQGTEGKSLPYFKGLIKAIEESNPPYKFDFNEGLLSRKLIGGNLREEEYVKKDKTIGLRLKPAYLCSIQSIKEGGHRILPTRKLAVSREPGDDADFAPPPPDDMDQRPANDDLPF
jgi:hypothetical protein